MYTKVQLEENLYHIEDSYGNCASLITGKCKAVLFDTTLGEGDLKSYIEGITSLPLTVINSHCHLDHIGCNCLFDKVYMNKNDWELSGHIKRQLELCPDETVSKMPYCLKSLSRKDLLRIIEPGDELDLGGTRLRVIDLKGHTPGSIGLLLCEQRILLAGDAFAPQACVFFPESLPLEEYRRTLERAISLPFDRFVLSHSRKTYPKRLIERFLACCDLPGKSKGYPFRYSIIPAYRGTVYFLEYNNPDADGIVCIITK